MKVFVFDLDFTLWNAGGTWCDSTNPPYSWEKNKLLDSSGRWIRLYDDVIRILTHLKNNGKHVAVASRTYEPEWARELLHLFDIDKYFDLKEIYPADKTKHLKRIRDHFNVLYSEIVFFDDEYRNIAEVQQLGVESVFIKRGIGFQDISLYL